MTIDASVNAHGAEISVDNMGEPIGEQHLPHQFERFFRCDPARSQGVNPRGLGLAIVRSIMQLYGGLVGVTSGADGSRSP